MTHTNTVVTNHNLGHKTLYSNIYFSASLTFTFGATVHFEIPQGVCFDCFAVAKETKPTMFQLIILQPALYLSHQHSF